MDLKTLTESLLQKDGTIMVGNLLGKLIENQEFRVKIKATLSTLVTSSTCVVVPPINERSNFGTLINDIACIPAVRTLITVTPENLKRLNRYNNKKKFLIVAPVFFPTHVEESSCYDSTQNLIRVIGTLKSMGGSIKVLCFIAQDKAELEDFTQKYNVKMTSLTYFDEI